MSISRFVSCLIALCFVAGEVEAQSDGSLFSEAMHWRSIGPLRGGRTKAAAGDPSHAYTFYMAQVNGGVWKTNDAGRTWRPIFDDQPTQSVGAIAVAPSDPNTIYVGSGEGLPRPDLSVGDGLYRSTDGGAHWTHVGLRDAQQIPQIAIDPTNAQRLLQRIGREMERMAQQGLQPVLICSSRLRLPLKRLTERSLPNLTVLSFGEVSPQVSVVSSGPVSLDDA